MAKEKAKAIDSNQSKPIEAIQLTPEELAVKVTARKARKLEKNKRRRERQKAAANVEAGSNASP